MKRLFFTFIVAGLMALSGNAQDAKTIQLEQTKGEFVIQELQLKAGEYIFEVSNGGVDHEVGFVIAPADAPDEHIKAGYLNETVESGEKATSKVVKLEKGNYIYFCPLNPTPKYQLTVL